MFCKQCGIKNEDGSKFCEACGMKMVMPRQGESERGSDNPRLVSHERTVSNYGDTELVSQDPIGDHSKGTPYDREGFGIEPTPRTQNNAHRGSAPKKRKKLLLIGFGALLLVAILLAGWVFMGIQSTRAFNDAMDEGNRYLLAENLEQAEAHFLRAIDINPRQVEPYLALADIYLAWDRPDLAIEILEQGRDAVSEEDRGRIDDRLDEIIGGDRQVSPTVDIEPDVDEEPRFRISWVLEPSIEADDINYIQFGSPEVSNNQARTQHNSPFAVITQGGSKGLIRNDGTMFTEMIYEEIFVPFGDYALLPIEPFEEPVFLHILVDNELLSSAGFGGGGSSYLFFYYNGLQSNATCMHDQVMMGSPTHPLPVMRPAAMPQALEGEFVDFREWYVEQRGLYGVFYQGEMQTDFVYTNMGAWSSGLFAVELDGRWGYINETGEIVIPIEYDSTWLSRCRLTIDVPFAYAATEGFVALSKDGVWELRDTTGEIVIEPGEFEAIRPVIEGRSWVKQDGLWGIIEITEIISNEEEVEVDEDVAMVDDRWRELFIDYIRNNPHHETMAHVSHQILFIDNQVIPQVLINNGSTAAGMELLSFYDGELIVTLLPLVYFSYVQGENIFVFHGGRMDHFFENVGSLQRGRMVFHEMGFWEYRGYPEQHFYWYSGIVPRENWFDEEQRDRFVSISQEEYNRRLREAFDFSRASNWWPIDREWVDAQEIIRIIEEL